jgi:acetyl-CoA acyltransferase
VNDGACALLLADEASAAKYGLTPRARVVGMATAGVAPRIMGIGPSARHPEGAGANRPDLDQMDVIELNEAFAAQGLAVLRALGLQRRRRPRQRLGRRHCAGPPAGRQRRPPGHHSRQPPARHGGRYALCTMCIGVGQGIAVILERV